MSVTQKKAPSYRKRPKPELLGLIRTMVFESFLKIPLKMHHFGAGSETSGFPGDLNLDCS